MYETNCVSCDVYLVWLSLCLCVCSFNPCMCVCVCAFTLQPFAHIKTDVRQCQLQTCLQLTRWTKWKANVLLRFLGLAGFALRKLCHYFETMPWFHVQSFNGSMFIVPPFRNFFQSEIYHFYNHNISIVPNIMMIHASQNTKNWLRHIKTIICLLASICYLFSTTETRPICFYGETNPVWYTPPVVWHNSIPIFQLYFRVWCLMSSVLMQVWTSQSSSYFHPYQGCYSHSGTNRYQYWSTCLY